MGVWMVVVVAAVVPAVWALLQAALGGAGKAAVRDRRAAAVRLGLSPKGSGRDEGEVDGLPVVLETSPSPGGRFRSLRIRVRLTSGFSALHKPPPPWAVFVGDPGLAEVALAGDPGEILAALSPSTRRNLALRIRTGMRLVEGTLEIDEPLPGPEAIELYTRKLLEFGRQIQEPLHRPRAEVLAERATADPLPGVRLAALLALCAGPAAALGAVPEAARADADPAVRAAAAFFGGAAAREVARADRQTEPALLALLESAGRYDAVRRFAAAALGEFGSPVAAGALTGLGEEGAAALASLRERHPSTEGRLSMSEGGQVSIARGPGAVSLSKR